jgi:lipoyl(octanoyl) transferase
MTHRSRFSTSHQSPVTSHESPLDERIMSACLTIDLGLIGYAEAYELQKRVVAARKAGAIDDVQLFCEHPHVITQGRSGKRANLLASENVLRQKGVEYFETSRGGDITYHGPGQIVGYPILNLGAIKRDVVWYVRMLEEAMIRASAELGIAAQREEGKTGIWVDHGSFTSHESQVTSHDSAPEKLAAIGVHISRWVTSHGFAYNVATDLRYFELIVPCGIAERKATSLEKLLERRVGMDEVKPLLAKHLGEVFGLQMQPAGREELLQRLERAEQAVAVA